MIYPITPTTLKETELQRRPALQDPTIFHCQRAYEHVYRCVLKKKKSKTLAGLEGSEAFIEAMPALVGIDNICTFVACVTYGVSVGVLLEQTAALLYRASHCAMAALALKVKLEEKAARQSAAQPKVPQPLAAQPSSQPAVAQPKVRRPKIARPSASQPKVAQFPVSQPSIAQPSAVQPTVPQPAESQPPATQPTACQPSETSQQHSEKSSKHSNQLKQKDLTKWQLHTPLKTNKLHPPKKSENPHFPSENSPLPSQISLPSSEITPQSTLECP
jgi:hypothetical protein